LRDPYLELAERLRGELADLDSSVHKSLKSWAAAKKGTKDQDVYLDSVALNLHGFYSGLEKLFELIARHIDGSSSEGAAWHRDLVSRMADDLPGIRPAVISKEIAKELDQYRRFRHLVRNVYAMNLRPGRISELVDKLPGTWSKLSAELQAFSEFLKQLSEVST
jgi:hypothetical protein